MPPLHRAGAQGDAHGGHHAGNAGEDTGEQDDGDTVADTKFGDLLTHPHHEGRAGDEGHDDDQGGPEAGVGQDVGALHQGVVAPALQDGDGHRGVAGDGLDLLLALLAAFTGQALQSGNGDGQQLDDDGAVDVGLDAQGEHSRLCERAAGHNIIQAQHRGGHGAEVVGQHLGVHPGHRDRITDAEDQQDQSREHDLLAQLGNAPRFFDRLDHVKSPLPFHRLLRSLP